MMGGAVQCAVLPHFLGPSQDSTKLNSSCNVAPCDSLGRKSQETGI
jgi:hypothetical protein